MTHPISLTAVFEDLSRLQKAAVGLGGSRRRAFLARMERLDGRRRETVGSDQSMHLDIELLKAREALEEAWAVEIEKMIALRKTGTLEAKAAVEAARNATARIVMQIEAQRAETADGLKAKARAGQRRRNGAPNPPRRDARAQ
jgi:uncharacterized protein YhaN